MNLDTIRTAASAYCGWKLAMVDNNKIIIVWVLSFGPEHGPAHSIFPREYSSVVCFLFVHERNKNLSRMRFATK